MGVDVGGWGWSVVKCEGFQWCRPMHFSGKVLLLLKCAHVYSLNMSQGMCLLTDER